MISERRSTNPVSLTRFGSGHCNGGRDPMEIPRCQYKTNFIRNLPIPTQRITHWSGLADSKPVATHGSVGKIRYYQNPPIAVLSDSWVTHGLIKNQTPTSLDRVGSGHKKSDPCRALIGTLPFLLNILVNILIRLLAYFYSFLYV
jgi:hypothetical protein